MIDTNTINLFILNSSTGAAKIIAMGLFSAAIITVVLIYRQLKGSGILTKHGRELRNLSENIRKLDLKVDNLKKLRRDDIIDESELRQKTDYLIKEKEILLNKISLRKNSKYYKLIKAEKDGLITKEELKTKIEQLQDDLINFRIQKQEFKVKVRKPDSNTKKSNKPEFALGIHKIDENYYHKCYKIDQGQLEIFGILENRNYLGDKVLLNGKIAANGIYNIDWYTPIIVKNGVITE